MLHVHIPILTLIRLSLYLYRRRECFMSIWGVNLPPIFYGLVPSLKAQAPHLLIHTTAPQPLPDLPLDSACRDSDIGVGDDSDSVGVPKR